MNKTNNKKGFIIFSIALFVVFVLLEILFPLTGDDWFWGGDYGIDILSTWFAGYNGRYAGNLLEMALTRVSILKVLVKALFFYLIILLTYLVTKTKNITVFAFSAMMFFILPKVVFVQGIVWTAGFANYVSPVVFALLYLLISEKSHDIAKKKTTVLYSIASIVIGFIGCLFMENMTIYYLFLALCTFIYSTAKNKKFATVQFAFGIGSLAGAICMFTNSVYLSIFKGDDNYRTVSMSLSELIETVTEHLYCTINYLFLSNAVFISILSALLLGLLIISYKSLGKKAKVLAIICETINFISLALLYLKDSFLHWNVILYLVKDEEKEEQYRIYLLAILAVIYFLSAFISAMICIRSKERRTRVAFEAVSALVILAPLFIVTPFGPRCVYPVYAFMALMNVEILAELIDQNINISKISKFLLIPIIAVCVGINIYHFSIYIPIHQVDKERTQYVSEQVEEGKTEIELYKLPYDSYVWHGNPDGEKWQGDIGFKSYYGIDENSELELINYQP